MPRTVRGRIVTGFALLVITFAAVVLGSAWLIRQHQAALGQMQNQAETNALLEDVKFAGATEVIVIHQYVLSGYEQLIPVFHSYSNEALEMAHQIRERLEADGRTDEVEKLDILLNQNIVLTQQFETAIEARRQGKLQEASVALQGGLFQAETLGLTFDELQAAGEQRVVDLRRRVDQAGDLAFWLLLLAGGVGVATAMAGVFLIGRSVLKPLSALEGAALALADGDLRVRAATAGPAELARLGSAFNQMTEALLDASKRRELEAERERAFAQMRASERRYRLLFERNQAGVYRTSLEGGILQCNESLARMMGYDSAEELVASTAQEQYAYPADRSRFLALLTRDGKVNNFEVWLRRRDGAYICVLENATLLTDDATGEPGLIEGTMIDITQRKRDEEELIRLAGAMRLSSDSIVLTDMDGVITDANEAAVSLYGTSHKAALIGKKALELVAPEDRAKVQAGGRQVMEKGFVKNREYRVIAGRGERVAVETNAALLRDGEGKPMGCVEITRDISERKRAEETIRRLAYHDSLTGLPNRELFKDRLTQALAQARRKGRMIAIAFLDLDRFKDVNDTVGHAAGDILLRDVALRLSGILRASDTVARIGGDEFTMLLSEVATAEDASDTADRILAALRNPWFVDGHEFHITGSIGISIYPGDGHDAETLLNNADTAMYRAKEEGRDSWHLYNPLMNAEIAQRVALENDLRHALEREEFVVHYQPQLEITSGRVVGVEALVRWQHPERNLVYPGDFIVRAEECGVIVPLGELVLRTACAQARAWQEAGHPLSRVAVNVSARQFRQGLLRTVTTVLAETGLDPRHLQIEITEGVAMEDAGFTRKTLSDLRALGVQIALDDFGTGHSSLSYLRSFPIDSVKIDGSFIQDVTRDPASAALVTAIIAMGHSLGLTVIAEGVETDEQLAFLREPSERPFPEERRCDEYQGFLFSRALPATEVESLLLKRPRRLPTAAAAKRR